MATIKAGTYKFKDSPTLQALRQQALRFTCTTESGVTENWYFIEVSTSQIAYNNEDADYPQTAYSNGVWNSTYSFRQTIALATDQSVSDEFYTWFKANIELSLHNQVEQFISDAYDAVVSKQGTIPTNKNLQNLAGAITSISTGVDTSDGNIEPTTVLKGYKGYAKGVAVNGAIETYDGTVEDVKVVYTISNVNSRTTGLSAGGDLRAKFDEPPTSETDFVIRFADTSTDRYIEVKPTTPLTAKKIYVWGYGGGGDSDSNGLFVVDNLNSSPRQVIANGKLASQRVSYNNAEMYEFTQDEYNVLFSHDAYDY